MNPQECEKGKAALAFGKFQIETDGTAKGTKILLNGKPIENLGYISLSFYNDGLSNPLSLGFTTKDKEAKPGSLIQTSYWSLIPPKEGANAAQAQASVEPQPSVPAEALPRDQRQNIYRHL